MADPIIQNLSWDSEFFNLKVGEITVGKNGVTLSPDNEGYDLLYAKGNADFTITLAGYRETFAEVKVIFRKELTSSGGKKTQFVFSDQDVPFNVEELYQLAFESGKYSRFKLDRNFEVANFQDLYRIWVDNSLNRNFADAVLLYIENKDVLGFVTYKRQQDFATIGLIAVSPNAQGKGIGSQLMAETERRLVLSGVNELRIPTQLANEGACSFYKKQGYDIAETTHIKHYWKSK